MFNIFVKRAPHEPMPPIFHYDIPQYPKYTKTTTTKALIFSHLYFFTKFLPKNRTNWIFTNRPKRCIIKSRVKSWSASALYHSCTTCVFSAKYQSNDIVAQWKGMLCFSFKRFSKKQKKFSKNYWQNLFVVV